MISVDSSAWTGRYWHVPDLDDRYIDDDDLPRSLMREIAEDEAIEEREQAWKALAMLWAPAIRHPARRGEWTIYDGHERARGDDWTLWRAIVATFAIATGRRWGQRQAEAADRAWARWQIERRNPRFADGRWREPPTPRAGDSFDMGHWEGYSDGYGHGAMVLQLYPWARVEIFHDGECTM